MSENLRTYTKSLYGFDATVARVSPAGWGDRSPCEAWTAADVVAHNVDMNRMIAGFTRGAEAAPPTLDPSEPPNRGWRRSLDDLFAALDSQGALQVVAKTPWGEMPVDKFLGFAWVDPLLHTWDLAKASGQSLVLDAALVARGLAQLERAGDSLRGGGRFGPAVQTEADAGAVDAFVAISGRDPKWE